MNKHLNQCKHNEDFLKQLSLICPDSFFDWKTTACFYCGTHLIRGYAFHNKETLGDRHSDVFSYLENSNGGIESTIYKAFKKMYRNSRDCRYNGFTSRENFERFAKIKLDESKTQYGFLKEGLKVEEEQAA